MGDVYEQHEALADEYRAMSPAEQHHVGGHEDQPSPLCPLCASRVPQVATDDFDTADSFDLAEDAPMAPPVKREDPLRPEAKRGRYSLPHPETGKKQSWRRATNSTKPFEDRYHLELWVQRNVAVGLGILIRDGRINARSLASHDVKEDKNRLNNMVQTAQDVAEAYKMADEGTALHASVEAVLAAGGDLNRAPEKHRPKVRMFLDALSANGLRVVPNMVERVIVSTKYQTAGKLDYVLQLPDGSFAIGDLKTGDSLDLSSPGISAQMDIYEDGWNSHGVFNGHRYEQPFKVRDDFAVVIHLPSTRNEVAVHRCKLAEGRRINAVNQQIFDVRKIKAKDVLSTFDGGDFQLSADQIHAYWSEQLNACHDREQMIQVARRAKGWGQWTARLGDVARNLEKELLWGSQGMGS